MNNEKTGLFLCKCGVNISNFVDLDDVCSWSKNKDNISFTQTHDLLCSPAGKKFVEETLSANKVDNVIIAACSPKMHEKTFQEVAQNAGYNMAKIQLANIREQCGWVTKDKKASTQKAKALINAAIKRSAFNKDLVAKTMKCLSDILIIGGGIAGIEAALLAANAGRKVTIIEKDISLGGNIIKTDEIAPSMECAPCVLAPRLSELKDNKNITVVSNADVVDVLGFFGNFEVKVKQKARFVNDSCIGCEACFDVCPASAKSAFHLNLGDRKAIYTAFAGSVPATAVIDEKSCKHFIDNSCDACVKECPFQSINFEDKDKELSFNVGSIIVATGCHPSVPDNLKLTSGFGTIDNVYSMPQFERIASSNGPYMGDIQLKNGQKPKSMAVVHCAGSLSDDSLPYCSGICCTNAIKAGELLRKQVSDAKIINIHDRLVLDGITVEKMHKHQIKEGTTFCKTNDITSVKLKNTDKGIEVCANGIDTFYVDMVVLSTGIMPHPTAKKVAELLNIEIDEAGFYKADQPVLHATGSTLDGIYLAGTCASPCNSTTAITRGYAAAGDALSRLIPGKEIELEVMTCYIDDQACGGCKLCISVCPYKAISFDDEKNISLINEAICRGCGTCAATCPSDAAIAKHFTNEQIFAEIEGVIHE